MNIIMTKKFVTKRVIRVSLLLTIALVIWHLTLLKSDAPYINSIASWVMTVVAPFLACTGINIIIVMYKGWFGSKVPGEIAQSSSGSDLGGADIEVLLAIALFVILLPIILFILPSGVLVGLAYYKHTVWDMIVSNITQYTTKEEIFVGVLTALFAIGISVIIWDLIIIGYNAIKKSIKWAWGK